VAPLIGFTTFEITGLHTLNAQGVHRSISITETVFPAGIAVASGMAVAGAPIAELIQFVPFEIPNEASLLAASAASLATLPLNGP
jgi:hypothetical protein